MFGHEKSTFTGANRRRIGKFEQCNGGTILLDEIGDMPLALQAKILRLLQEQAFERLGGNEMVRTNVRLIAATHRDLKEWSEKGKFRPDLYYRLNVFTIRLPPLRERSDDLPPLVQHYLRRFSRELGRQVCEVAAEALELLRGYSWPGNIRELQSVLKQALLKASGTTLLPAFLPSLGGEAGDPVPPPKSTAEDANVEVSLQLRLGADLSDLYAEAHRQVDRLLLPRVLQYTRANLHAAARMLGISRDTFAEDSASWGSTSRASWKRKTTDPKTVSPTRILHSPKPLDRHRRRSVFLRPHKKSSLPRLPSFQLNSRSLLSSRWPYRPFPASRLKNPGREQLALFSRSPTAADRSAFTSWA